MNIKPENGSSFTTAEQEALNIRDGGLIVVMAIIQLLLCLFGGGLALFIWLR